MTLEKIIFYALFGLISWYSSVDCRLECIARDYGNTGTVCVCNQTYCDYLDAINRTQNGEITLYESSLSGLRFKNTTIGLGSNNILILLRQTIKLNCSRNYQKIIGFGGSFTDSTGINIKSLPNSMQNTLLSDYFSPNGIEYSECRVPIAGTDFSTRPYTYDDVVNDTDLSEFSLQPEDYDYKIPLIKLAQSLSVIPLQLFACSWSSPAWTKINNNITCGSLIGQPGTQYYQIWSNYLVKFLDAYKNNSIEFWGLSAQNEPSAIFPAVDWNCLTFTTQQERDFIKLNLGPTLQQNGYGKDELNLIVGDDQRPGINLPPLINMPSVYDWAATIGSDPDSDKYVSGVAFHWYSNALFSGSTSLLDAINRDFPQYFLLATEACNGYLDNTVRLGSWQRGEAYAVDIIQDLNHFTAGWVDWNMALNLNGGPTWVSNFVDSPVIVNASANEYYKQPMFYVLGHFTKFLPPDSVRVEATPNINIINFYTTAFLRPDNGTVVIAVNTNVLPVQLTIRLCNGTQVIRTVLPHSIQTYIWWN